MQPLENLNRQLLVAAKSGKEKEVIDLIARGADVNAKDEYGRTSLNWALSNDVTQTALALIESGADINAKDNDGNTPLHNSSSFDRAGITLFLISVGADVNLKKNNGKTPLHIACINGCAGAALALVSNGADVHAKNIDGKTPLHFSSFFRHVKTSLILIAYGANTAHVHQNSGNLKNLSMHQAAAQGGFTGRLIELLSEHPLINPQDTPEALVDFAKRHEKHETAAAIQSFMATQAIEKMMTASQQIMRAPCAKQHHGLMRQPHPMG